MRKLKIVKGASTELNLNYDSEILLGKILEFFCFEHINSTGKNEYDRIKDIPHLVVRYDRIIAALKAFDLYNEENPIEAFVTGKFITELHEDTASEILKNVCRTVIEYIPRFQERILRVIAKGKYQHQENGFAKTLQELFCDLWKYRLLVEKLRRFKGTGIIESDGGYYIGTLYLLEFSDKELLPIIEKLNGLLLPIIDKGDFSISEKKLVLQYGYPTITDAELMEMTANYQLNQKQ